MPLPTLCGRESGGMLYLFNLRIRRCDGLSKEVIKVSYLAVAGLILPSGAAAQAANDRAKFDARMNVLDRSVADLSI